MRYTKLKFIEHIAQICSGYLLRGDAHNLQGTCCYARPVLKRMKMLQTSVVSTTTRREEGQIFQHVLTVLHTPIEPEPSRASAFLICEFIESLCKLF
jgi:hypothetical protein